jgi:hypothetical protein
METVTIAATAEHGPGFSELALIAFAIVAVGLFAWQLILRSRGNRSRS